MHASLVALLDRLIDYAGLFPPAGLPMADAVKQYAEHRASASSWMLGRFVVPAARLEEFARESERWLPIGGDVWRLSVLFGADAAADAAAVAAFNAAHRGAMCDTAESKAATPDDIGLIAKAVRSFGITVYVEIPVRDDPAPLVDALAARGLRAKIRTGGTSAAAFPAPNDVVRFLGACVRARTPFKATAGLHHPLRGEYRLTYDANSERGPMYGFLNIFLTTALLRDGGSEEDAIALLTERDPSSLAFAADGIRWRERLFLTARLSQLRERAATAFGSCSFAEPVEELTAMQLS